MSAFLARSNLSGGDLRLFLSNNEGYSQDAVSVLWTVHSIHGDQISGSRLPAIRKSVGEYYAPWKADVRGGNYVITWEILESYGQQPRTLSENFFVVDPSDYNFGIPLVKSGIPMDGGNVFLSGSTLKRGDLPLYLTNGDGYPENAYLVRWYIADGTGRALTSTYLATNAATGEYYAPWTVDVGSGSYTIVWEWQHTSGGQLQSSCMRFGVVSPSAPYSIFIYEPCVLPIQFECTPRISYIIPKSPSVCSDSLYIRVYQPSISTSSSTQTSQIIYSSSTLTSYEVSRVVHLGFGLLPSSGAYTNQPVYVIPPGIRDIAFYITYVRGAAGGYAGLRLLWGNGTEESQETVLDTSMEISSPTATQDLYLQELDGPAPADSNLVTFTIYASIPGGAKTVRLVAAEKGVPSTPGHIGITLTASTN